MVTIQVVVPYLAQPWALEDMLESFGESDVPVLVVDNSPTSEVYRSSKDEKPPIRFTNAPNVEVVAYPQNIGATAAWNLGLKKGADQTLIISQWVRFSPAEFSRRPASWGLNHVAAGIERLASPYGLTFGDQGYHLICIGRKTVEAIGLFDENLYFYGNDDDYVHRMNLAGIKGELPDWGDWHDSGVYSITFAAHKRGASIPDADRTLKAMPYYWQKWCSSMDIHPGDYLTPFNDPNNSLKYWPDAGLGGKWDD